MQSMGPPTEDFLQSSQIKNDFEQNSAVDFHGTPNQYMNQNLYLPASSASSASSSFATQTYGNGNYAPTNFPDAFFAHPAVHHNVQGMPSMQNQHLNPNLSMHPQLYGGVQNQGPLQDQQPMRCLRHQDHMQDQQPVNAPSRRPTCPITDPTQLPEAWVQEQPNFEDVLQQPNMLASSLPQHHPDAKNVLKQLSDAETVRRQSNMSAPKLRHQREIHGGQQPTEDASSHGYRPNTPASDHGNTPGTPAPGQEEQLSTHGGQHHRSMTMPQQPVQHPSVPMMRQPVPVAHMPQDRAQRSPYMQSDMGVIRQRSFMKSRVDDIGDVASVSFDIFWSGGTRPTTDIRVSRRYNDDKVNGTKLLNLLFCPHPTGFTRGKRDGELKKIHKDSKEILKNGQMHLKGCWITLAEARTKANHFNLRYLVWPLLEDNFWDWLEQVNRQKGRGQTSFGNGMGQKPEDDEQQEDDELRGFKFGGG